MYISLHEAGSFSITRRRKAKALHLLRKDWIKSIRIFCCKCTWQKPITFASMLFALQLEFTALKVLAKSVCYSWTKLADGCFGTYSMPLPWNQFPYVHWKTLLFSTSHIFRLTNSSTITHLEKISYIVWTRNCLVGRSFVCWNTAQGAMGLIGKDIRKPILWHSRWKF